MPRPSLFNLVRTNYYLHGRLFREAFRVDREVFMQLEHYWAHHLAVSRRNNSLDPREQLLTALHFIGNGAQYHVNGHMHTISKSTVCRCVHRVCNLIARFLMPLYVRWPTSSIVVEREFFQKAGFPSVRGAVDGTLVHIDAPGADEPIFVSRDNKHSINVLLVSGPRMQFFFVSAKSPGSFHDSRALRISQLWHSWEIRGWRPDNDHRSLLLGDSAYPLRPWLMPPIVRDANANIRPLAQAVSAFLQAHRKTRFIVECAIGILKEEYPCLNHFRFQSVKRICSAIYACVTLHNMQNNFRNGSYEYDAVLNRLARQEADIDDDEEEEELDVDNIFINTENVDQTGIIRQRELLQIFAERM